jgi:hypothetical protein
LKITLTAVGSALGVGLLAGLACFVKKHFRAQDTRTFAFELLGSDRTPSTSLTKTDVNVYTNNKAE